MDSLKRCTSCVLPATLPSVRLDTDGVCNYCRQYKSSFGNIDSIMPKRKEEIENVFDRVKALGRPYDCLVMLSGGKDSTYALYLCSQIYGMRCLCVTFNNGYMSSHAKSNIMNAVEAAGADHLFYTVNSRLLNDLYKMFLLKVGEFCAVCMRGIFQCTQIVSKEYSIPLIINGHGSRMSYISDIREVFQGANPHFFKNVIKGTNLEKKAIPMVLETNRWDMQKMLRLTNKISRRMAKRNVIPIHSVQNILIYDYFAPSKQEVLDTIKTEMGWKSPEGEVEHMDCKLHHIASFIRQLKFPEVTDTTFYHSGLIRRGLMKREDALLIEKEKLNHKETPRELDYFLKEIGLTFEEFNDAAHDWRKAEQYRDSGSRNPITSIFERIKKV